VGTSRSEDTTAGRTAPAPFAWGRRSILQLRPQTRSIDEVCRNTITEPEPRQGVVHTAYSAAMAGCLIAAIDAVRSAAEYAEAKSVRVNIRRGPCSGACEHDLYPALAEWRCTVSKSINGRHPPTRNAAEQLRQARLESRKARQKS